jgi:hypothetical protein
MLLAHAVTLTQARSDIAALADRARTTEASSRYEHVLLQLDLIHGDDAPATDTSGLTDERVFLLASARSCIEELVTYGVDALQIEVALAMLDDAQSGDEP